MTRADALHFGAVESFQPNFTYSETSRSPPPHQQQHAFVSMSDISPLPAALPSFFSQHFDDIVDADGEVDEIADDVKPEYVRVSLHG